MLSGKSSSYAENTHVLQRITTKTTFGSLAAFPFPARQYLRTKFFKKLQQRLLLETGLCVSPLHVFKCVLKALDKFETNASGAI